MGKDEINEISQSEWRSLLLSRLDNLSDKMDQTVSKIEMIRITDEIKDVAKDHGKRINELENDKNKAIGIVIGIQIVIGAIWASITYFFSGGNKH